MSKADKSKAEMSKAERDVTIYGIATCGTVKKARAWLEARGVPYTWVDYRQQPVPAERVAGWVAALGARPMRNTSGGAFRALGPEKDGWDDARWTRAFQEDAMLIRRPVLELDGKPVAVGFKESDWARLLG